MGERNEREKEKEKKKNENGEDGTGSSNRIESTAVKRESKRDAE